MAFRFRFDDDAAAFDFDHADDDVAADERAVGRGIDALFADADRPGRTAWAVYPFSFVERFLRVNFSKSRLLGKCLPTI